MSDHILLIDDNERLCAILTEELEEEGYEVDAVHDGRAGIQALVEGSYDLVVLDIRMPVMDGLDALGKILARDRRTPIVLHTAYGTYKDDFRAWSADAYVTKSADTGPLKGTIRRLLEDRRGSTGEDGEE